MPIVSIMAAKDADRRARFVTHLMLNASDADD
jgi:hypothetical protein